MSVASPRKSFHQAAHTPSDYLDTAERLRSFSSVLRYLQENMQKHPTKVVSTTANYAMVDSDLAIKVNATTADRTVTLLTAGAREGRGVILKKIDASSNVVIIDGNGSETIDGAATQTLTVQWSTKWLVSDGTNWIITSVK